MGRVVNQQVYIKVKHASLIIASCSAKTMLSSPLGWKVLLCFLELSSARRCGTAHAAFLIDLAAHIFVGGIAWALRWPASGQEAPEVEAYLTRRS